MSSNDLTIFHAHTGSSVKVNRHYFLSLDELKRFCSSQFSIPSQQIFLLSSFGLKLKSSSLEHADEIFVYDKNLFSIDNTESVQRYILSQYSEGFVNLIHPINSPLLDIDLDRLASSKNSRQMVGLLTTNLGWVAAIESDSCLFVKKTKELEQKIAVLFKSLKVANLYIENYCTEVKKSYDASLDFLMGLQKQTLSLTWRDNFQQLESITSLEGKPLADLLDASLLQAQAKECLELNDLLNQELVSQRTRISTSNNTRTAIDEELDKLESETSNNINSGSPDEWLGELQKLSERVKSDTKHFLDGSKGSLDELSIDVILDIFNLHKSEFVTKIHALSLSLYQKFNSNKNLFMKLQVSLSSFLQRLSQSQGEMVILRESLKTVSQDISKLQDLESHLAHTVDLPLLYGLYIVEGIRRSEWMKALKSQAAGTNEKFAAIREKEIKTRSNWIKNYGDIMKILKREVNDFNSESLVSFDFSINDNNTGKPQVFSFEDASSYIQQLQENKCDSEIIDALLKSLNDIPAKLAKISNSTQESSNESKDSIIKGYKGRIKKLESLLHQEQFKNFQQWPSSADRLSIASRYSINEKMMTSRPESSLKIPFSATLPDSGELAKLTEDNRTLKNDLKRHKNTVDMLNDELKSAKQEYSAKDFENRTLRNEIEQLKENYELQISKLQLNIGEQEVAKTVLEGKLAKIEEEVSHHTTSLMEKDKLIGTLTSEHKDVLGSLENQLSIKVTEMDALKEIHENTKSEEANVQALNTEISELKALVDEKLAHIESIEKQLWEKDRFIDEKTSSLKEKDEMINKLTSKDSEEVETLHEKNTALETEVSQLTEHLRTLKENHERLSSMKNDLLENMSNRESEFAKEKGLHQEEVESLKMKLEDFEKAQLANNENIASLTECNKKQTQTIIQLVVVINSLIIKSRDLSDILVIFYDQLCASLKSMGLLAVRSGDHDTSIIRVKGLKKAGSDLSATVDLANGLKPDLEQEVYKLSSWSELPDSNLLNISSNSDSSIASESLDAIVDMLVETYNLTSFEEKYLKFVSCVTNLNDSYLSSIAKRFKEVEHLAKKELKENRKLKESNSTKISVRDFEVGDLVLFLPTKSSGSGNQWAAFNDMEDSKFLLKGDLNVSPQKQWFIGCILEIQEIGTKEFMIRAKDVTLN